MLAYTTVKVAYVNPPKEGKKMGSIKTPDGQYYGVWADKLYQFQQGQSYDVEYETGQYNGRETRTIKKVIETGRASSGSAQRTSGGSQPDDAKATAIFVTGIIGKALQGAGTVPDRDTMADMVYNCAAGFEAGMKRLKQASQQRAADPQAPTDFPTDGDEIPF